MQKHCTPERARVTVLVPAHQEEDVIGGAITALLAQTRPPDRVVVCADNCTDATIPIARSFGGSVEVFETADNRLMKAGNLNQALGTLDIADDDFVLIVDADTELSPRWIERALPEFSNPEVGAVGGIFLGDGKNGLFGDAQGVEYARYRRQIRRDRGKARVLTGTSTVSRMSTFRTIRAKRESGELPGSGFYNVDALTEDYEMTVCIKRLGLKTVSPDGCTVITETMPTVSTLWKQRIRWQHGAIQVLQMHGMNRVTIPYALRQAEAGLSVFVNGALIAITAWAVVSGTFAIIPFWIAIGLIFYTERIVSGREYGKKGAAIAATVVVDIAFDTFISAIWIWSIWLTATGQKTGWGQASIDNQGVN